MKNTLPLFLLSVLLLGLGACTHENPAPEPQRDPTSMGYALVLNEGSWGSNNASISLLGSRDGEIVNDWFAKMNGRGLGDVAQDMVIYGTKAYATVTFSDNLEVIDLATGLSRRFALGGKKPRSIAVADGSLYISCYTQREVIKIDTAALLQSESAVAPIALSASLGQYQPEGIAVANGKLFVVSSWIADENQNYLYDSVVYVFNASTLEPETTLCVGLNLQRIICVGDSYLAVNYSGDYAAHPAGCAIIDASSVSVRQLPHALTDMASSNDGALYGYLREGYGSGASATWWRANPASLSMDELHLSSAVNNPYGIDIDPATGDFYITTDGNYYANGDLFCFDPMGNLRWKIEAESLPKRTVFLGQR